MWAKVKSWFGFEPTPQEQTFTEAMAVSLNADTDIEDFVLQFAKAIEATIDIRTEFNNSAMFSEQSIDLFLQVLDKASELDGINDEVRATIASQLWIRLARDTPPDEHGIARMIDFMAIAQRWHLKLIEAVKTRPAADYFIVVHYIEQSLVKALETLDSMSTTKEEEA